ncbi:hypothetical protein CGRA01v4_11877 [Colletotrichum graminicola]|nr:hypothetical protein CGRA01v4_11877 [Colletotrichum graminicola]
MYATSQVRTTLLWGCSLPSLPCAVTSKPQPAGFGTACWHVSNPSLHPCSPCRRPPLLPSHSHSHSVPFPVPSRRQTAQVTAADTEMGGPGWLARGGSEG